MKPIDSKQIPKQMSNEESKLYATIITEQRKIDISSGYINIARKRLNI